MVCCCACGTLQAAPPSVSAPPKAGSVKGAPASVKLRLLPQEHSPEMSCIRARGELVIGLFEGTRVPFFMRDEQGNAIGLDVEIAKGLARALGVKAKFRRVSTFDKTVECVVKRQCDIAVSKLSLTEKRALKALYTRPYVTAHKVLLVNRLQLEKYKVTGDESIEEIVRRHHPVIAVTRGTSYEDFAKRLFPEARIAKYDQWARDAIPKIMKGEYFALLEDEFQARKIMEIIPEAPLQLLMVRIKSELDPIFMVLPWSSHHLRDFVNRYLDLQQINYDVESLYSKYKVHLDKDREHLLHRWHTEGRHYGLQTEQPDTAGGVK